jgi:hypothetical protein
MIEREGIPGTISSEASRIRWYSIADHSGCKRYRADVADGFLIAMLSRDEVAPGRLLWHLSVSHRDGHGQLDRCPTWDELKHAFYRLVHVDVPFVLIFPRRSTPPENYVNLAETCLHLWESTEETLDL